MTNEQLEDILTKIQESVQVTRQTIVEKAAGIMHYVEATARVTRGLDVQSDRREADRVIQAMREQLAALMVSGGGLPFDQVVKAAKQGALEAAREGTG